MTDISMLELVIAWRALDAVEWNGMLSQIELMVFPCVLGFVALS